MISTLNGPHHPNIILKKHHQLKSYNLIVKLYLRCSENEIYSFIHILRVITLFPFPPPLPQAAVRQLPTACLARVIKRALIHGYCASKICKDAGEPY